MIRLEARVVNLDTLRRAMAEMPAAFFPAVLDGLKRMLYGFRKDFLERAPPHLSRRRRGVLSKENWPVRSSGTSLDTLKVVLFTGSVTAYYLEVGGTIRPQRKQFIALALDAAKNKSGTARLPGYSSPTSARRLRGAIFVFHEEFGKKVLLEVRRTKGKSRKIVPAFELVSSIEVKPILGFFAAWDAQGPDDALRRIGLSIDKVLRATARGAA